MYARGVAGLAGFAKCEEQYPASITAAQSIECAFLPYSATCRALKRLGKTECESMAAPGPVPVKPPPINSGGYVTGDPAAVIDQQIKEANDSTIDRLLEFFTDQAAQRPVCGIFETVGESGVCETDPAFPLVAVGIAAVAAFMLVRH